MEIKDLLDRFELLFNTNERISDLRRSYTDKDFSSIFRLLDNEELRKAVMEKNLHSIFRLFDENEYTEDIRKAVIEENMYSIFRVIPNLENDGIEELRKAVTEKNLHSIFRLVENEELRKAVVEENLYSIFRICNNEELRKLVLEDNVWSLWKILSNELETQFVSAFKSFYIEQVNYDDDCFSRGQLASKMWLIHELKKLDLDLGTVFLCAGWYGTLAVMMFESNLKINKVRSFDIDPSCVKIAERFNKPWEMDSWKFKAGIADILSLNYNKTTYDVFKPDGTTVTLVDIPNTIINTSCEHIGNFNQWYESIPDGTLVILQTNDYFDIEDHVNCSSSLIDFTDKTPMRDCLYEGELELPKYRRFLRIGYK
jgi:hypothetical protein